MFFVGCFRICGFKHATSFFQWKSLDNLTIFQHYACVQCAPWSGTEACQMGIDPTVADPTAPSCLSLPVVLGEF